MYSKHEDKSETREYAVHRAMLKRVDPLGSTQIKNPSYRGCTASDNFKNFQFFAGWSNAQAGFSSTDSSGRYWHLDKDILVPGNKHYSEATCVYIPHALNQFLTSAAAIRGELPVGVYKTLVEDKVYYHARCRDGRGGRNYLGCFPSPEDAYSAYCEHKEIVAKQLADYYSGVVDPRVTLALVNYKV